MELGRLQVRRLNQWIRSQHACFVECCPRNSSCASFYLTWITAQYKLCLDHNGAAELNHVIWFQKALLAKFEHWPLWWTQVQLCWSSVPQVHMESLEKQKTTKWVFPIQLKWITCFQKPPYIPLVREKKYIIWDILIVPLNHQCSPWENASRRAPEWFYYSVTQQDLLTCAATNNINGLLLYQRGYRQPASRQNRIKWLWLANSSVRCSAALLSA